MKTTLWCLVSLFALVFAVSPASATVYAFSFEFPPSQAPGVYEGFGTIVTGSFEGIDDGTYVTYGSNLRISVNGEPFPSDVAILTWNGSAFVPGAPVIAFDAAKNNFVFSDCITSGCTG